MPISTGIAWTARLMMYFVIGSPPVSAPLSDHNVSRCFVPPSVAGSGDGGIPRAAGPDSARGTRVAGAPSAFTSSYPEGVGRWSAAGDEPVDGVPRRAGLGRVRGVVSDLRRGEVDVLTVVERDLD